MIFVVVGIKDTVYWKQFTTGNFYLWRNIRLLLVSKILFIESNSQLNEDNKNVLICCCWYQRYCLLKAIHNLGISRIVSEMLLLVSKILFIESNSQHFYASVQLFHCCCWYQRYCLLKAIHNSWLTMCRLITVVVGIKDTVYWKQFTTPVLRKQQWSLLLLVSKILFIESNSQPVIFISDETSGCCWYQRYCLLKAIHNLMKIIKTFLYVVVGIKDTVYWKQFTTMTIYV